MEVGLGLATPVVAEGSGNGRLPLSGDCEFARTGGIIGPGRGWEYENGGVDE
jgi:hypothetical protein